jgi:hypothetical protein
VKSENIFFQKEIKMKKITTVFLMVSGMLLFAAGSFAQPREDMFKQREFMRQRSTMQPRGTMRQKSLIGQRGIVGQRGIIGQRGVMGQRGMIGQRGIVGQRGLIGQRQGRLLAILYARQDELKITDNQLEKIKSLTLKMEEDMIQYKNNMNSQQFELKKLMLDRENRDYEKTKSLMSRTSDMRHDMFIQRMKNRDEILNVLTEEQQKALMTGYRNFASQRQGFFINRAPRRFNR